MGKLQKNVRKSLIWPAYLIGLLWVIELFQVLSGLSFKMLGIWPRHWETWYGVFLAPLLHSGFPHLLANTPPLYVLTAMVLFFYRKVAIASFNMIYLLTGLAVWIFGRDNAVHIGASGVVYGLVAFVFWNGIFRRNLKSIVLALIVLFYYGGMFTGILPGKEDVSWESHLLGGLVGVFTSFWFMKRIEADEKKPVYSWELEEPKDESFFLDRDTFEKTKKERTAEKQSREDTGWFSDRT